GFVPGSAPAAEARGRRRTPTDDLLRYIVLLFLSAECRSGSAVFRPPSAVWPAPLPGGRRGARNGRSRAARPVVWRQGRPRRPILRRAGPLRTRAEGPAWLRPRRRPAAAPRAAAPPPTG